MVDVEQFRLAFVPNVQPLIVDALIGHAGEHENPASRGLHADGPAGGRAQTLSRRRGFSLQHHDASRRCLRCGRNQTAVAQALRVYAPGGEECGRAGGAGRFTQEFGHVEADAAGADDGDAAAWHFGARQHLVVAQYLGMVDPGDVGQARTYAAREHHGVVAASGQFVRADAMAGLQLDAALRKSAAEVAQRFGKFLARHFLGQVQLPADLGLRLVQGDAMAALEGGDGAGEAGGAGADHGDALRALRPAIGIERLVAGPWVDQAARDFVAEQVIQAALVAGDAGIDFIGAPLFRLEREGGIGQQRARERHQVGHTQPQQFFRQFRRVDAVGGHDRNRDCGLDARGGIAPGCAWHHVGDGGHARLVPADASIEHVHAGRFEFARELQGFLGIQAAFDQIEGRHAEQNQKIGADARARRAHDFEREAQPVCERAAVLVAAIVGARRGELADEVGFGAHDFDAVVAGQARELGAGGEVCDRLFHFGGRKRAWLLAVDGRRDVRCADRSAVLGIAPGVQDLQADFAACRVHRVGDFAMLGKFVRMIERARIGFEQPGGIRRVTAGDDQRHAAARARRRKRRRARCHRTPTRGAYA